MLRRLHLIRHGEVHNPDHLVYADLPGFALSTRGVTQAEAAAAHLAGRTVDALVSSPLDRARQTTAPIAAVLGLPVAVDERLTEWRLARRWAGTPWDDLPERFPGELEAYLSHPRDLPFASEAIDEVARRMAAVVSDLGRRHPDGAAVLVSHQDPTQALRLHLRGEPLDRLREDPPRHAAVITLERKRTTWREMESWAP